MEKLKKENGVTLVTIVITIGLLLILATITIKTLTESSQTIQKSGEIKNEVQKLQTNTQSQIDSLSPASDISDGVVIKKDTTAPTINKIDVYDVTNTSLTVDVSVTEVGSGLAKIEYSIDNGAHYVTPNNPRSKNYTFENLDLKNKTYVIKVKVTDVDNNIATTTKNIDYR